MCGSFIIGSFFLLAGLTIFVNIIFGINIPFGRIFWGLLLIYIGATLITGRSYRFNSCASSYRGQTTAYSNWMGSAMINFDAAAALQSITRSEFNTVMGSTELDLTHIRPELIANAKFPLDISINTVFGKTIVKLNKDVSIRIDARSAFASSHMPDNTSIAFGAHTYFSHGESNAIPVKISSNTVFGAIEFIRV